MQSDAPNLEHLLTEQARADATPLDLQSTAELLTTIHAADAEIAAVVGRAIPSIALMVDAIVDRLRHGGRLFYVGAGTSGRLGVLDASECPPTFGVSPELVQGIIAGGVPALTRSVEAAEDDPDAGAADLIASGFTRGDVLIGIAASGRTPYVLGAISKARTLGAITGGISCVPGSDLSRAVDLPIEAAVGPEIVTGSTRMRAGTATKLILNMLSTATMVRLGHVYGNLMVNVKPTNAKLVARAHRIIQQAAGVDSQHAAQLLERSGRSVRVAIMMGKKSIGREEAKQLLEKAEGSLRAALLG